ncbi:hypothetical protein I302_108776 [Kwoniella bestiolae CBS 10118]|uniref:Cell division control protein 45 n=1 Tax=Kwoniella bestiolae CBS 10118 TaxID=1296100 RepID=A0A1B9FU27_9TREE|nr:cell division control protein 45 [Kwoniella bestiolae CBS 10118]OCF22268.1 cell division control protein 45 [Kwoniella bestiolae CBS 10118]
MPLLLPPSDDLHPSDLTYTHAYNSIVSRVRRKGGSGSGGVVILAGTDVDGLLGARILCSLFKNDDVPYRLVPVGGYSELETRRDEALASEELHTLILLSLGSLLTLSSYFELPSSCHLHIIDSHRPWNLQNLFGIDINISEDPESSEGKIWVWGDGDEFTEVMDNVKKSWEALEYEPSDSGSSDDESDEDESDEAEEDEENGDEEDENEADANGSPSKRARKRRKAGSTEPKFKRQREDDDRPRRLPRAVREAHHERIQRYYASGTSYGQSVALTIYLLATVLERADNDILWYAILSVTHQYITSKIDRDSYESYQSIFQDEVVRLNHDPASAGGVKIPNPDDRSIVKSAELRFMLYRHWNLYESMLHSGYVAGRLGIWKEKGRKKLQGLLAKMGFSLQQCQQSWSHMDMDLKRKLPEQLESIAPEYGLIELSYPSFTRSFGFQLTSLSAADAVEVISSLLDIAVGVRLEVDREGGKGGGEWFGGTTRWNVNTRESEASKADGKENQDPNEDNNGNEGDGEGSGEERKKRRDNWGTTNFWIAYDACDDIALIRRSLPLSMTLHRSIIRAGSALLDKTIIRSLRTFRLAILKEGPDLRLFSHPSTLSRLAIWLVDATRDRWAERQAKTNNGKVKALPFVVACLNEERGSYMVVGVTGAPEFGDVRKNKFGLAFQHAAEESGSGTKHDMFDTSVVEVAQEDLQGFIESLHLRSG